jgi:NlpC/P60 family putative phage cell wall peptidase
LFSRERIVEAARGWIGTPYRHQTALKGVGCDCLGLLIGVWRDIVGEEPGRIPPYTPDWAEASGREMFADELRKYLAEIEVGEAREGDVVLFRWRAHLPAKHGAVLVARDRMVLAQARAVVSEVPLGGWWRRRMAYAFAFEGVGRVALKKEAGAVRIRSPLPNPPPQGGRGHPFG